MIETKKWKGNMAQTGKRCIQDFGGETGERGPPWKPYA